MLIAEGVATAATLHELTGYTAIVAFNAGNLVKVSQAYRERFPERAIYVAGDDDREREAAGKPNVGRVKGEEAAASVGGRALFPPFPDDVQGSDWNDLARSQGREAAQLTLLVAIRIAEREQLAVSIGAARLDERDTVKQWQREGAGLER